MSFYNLSIDIQGQKCVVVGGGKVALRKVRKLCQAKAQVSVVSLDFLSDFYEDDDLKNIRLIQSTYHSKYIERAVLVFAATSNYEVNEQVCRDAKALSIWVNSVNGIQYGSFIIPAVCTKDVLNIGITTEGKAPSLSKRFRQYFQAKLAVVSELEIQNIVRLREDYIKATDNEIKQELDMKIREKTNDIINQIEKRR